MANLRHSKSDHSLARSGSSHSLWEEEEAVENNKAVEQKSEFEGALQALSEWTVDHVKQLTKHLQTELNLTKQYNVSLTRINRATFAELFGRPIESIMRSDRSFMILPLSVYTIIDPGQSNSVRIGKILLITLLAGNNDYEGCEATLFQLYGIPQMNPSDERCKILVTDLLRITEDLKKQREYLDDEFLNTKVEELQDIVNSSHEKTNPKEVTSLFQSTVRRLRKLLRNEGSGQTAEDGSQNQTTNAKRVRSKRQMKPTRTPDSMLKLLKEIEREGRRKDKETSSQAWRRIRAASLYALATERQFEHFQTHDATLQEAALKSMHPGKKAQLPETTEQLHNRPNQQRRNSRNLPEAADIKKRDLDPDTPEGKLAALVRKWSAMSPSQINSAVATQQEELLAYLATTGIQPLISSVPLPKVDPIKRTKEHSMKKGRNVKSTSQLPSKSTVARKQSRVASAKSLPAKHHTSKHTKHTASAPVLPGHRAVTAGARTSEPMKADSFRQHASQSLEESTQRQYTPALRRRSTMRNNASRSSLRKGMLG